MKSTNTKTDKVRWNKKKACQIETDISNRFTVEVKEPMSSKSVSGYGGDTSARGQLFVSVPLVFVSLCYCQSPLRNDGL